MTREKGARGHQRYAIEARAIVKTDGGFRVVCASCEEGPSYVLPRAEAWRIAVNASDKVCRHCGQR